MALCFSALLLLAGSVTVSTLCSENYETTLLALWRGNPPEDIIENWVTERLTTVWMSSVIVLAQPGKKLDNRLDNLSCYQTIIDKDGVSATDYWTYKNKTVTKNKYDDVMEAPAIVTVMESGFTDMHLQLVFSRNGVYAMAECDTYPVEKDAFKPGALIRVLNYDTSNKEQMAAIESAKNVLENLKFTNGVDIPTSCSSTAYI